jgi:hypothetical protein
MAISAKQREFVRMRANDCCEYCRIREEDRVLAFHIDHIIPLKHGGADDDDNFCLGCYKCNGYKGSNVAGLDPQTGDPTRLYNPRNQVWNVHFKVQSDGTIIGLTPEGRVTVAVMTMNEESRVHQRQLLAAIGLYPCKKN